MKALKIANIVLAILLAVVTLGLIATQSLAALLAIATGLLFLYYIVLLLLVIIIHKRKNIPKGPKIIGWLLFLLPLIALLINPEGILNFLMQGVHLDMK